MFKKLWYFLFGGHDHKWKIISRGPIEQDSYLTLDYYGNSQIHDLKEKRIIGAYYILQCEHCGEVKKKDLITNGNS